MARKKRHGPGKPAASHPRHQQQHSQKTPQSKKVNKSSEQAVTETVKVENTLEIPCSIPLPPSPPPRRRPTTLRSSPHPSSYPPARSGSDEEDEERPSSSHSRKASSHHLLPISTSSSINSAQENNNNSNEEEEDEEELGRVEYGVVREKKHFSLVRLQELPASAPSSPRSSPSSSQNSPTLHATDPGHLKSMHGRRYSLTNVPSHALPETFHSHHQRSSSTISSSSSHSPPRSSPLRQFHTPNSTPPPDLVLSQEPDDDTESPELVTPLTPGFNLVPPAEKMETKEIGSRSGPPTHPPRRRTKRQTYPPRLQHQSGDSVHSPIPPSPPTLVECQTDPMHWKSESHDGLITPEHVVRTLQEDMEVLARKLIMATEARGEAEAEAEAMQDQLEDLSQSVFEEASEMVRSAKEATKKAEEENARLIRKLQEVQELRQLRENELVDLKSVLRRSLPASSNVDSGGGGGGPRGPRPVGVAHQPSGGKPRSRRASTITEEGGEGRFEFVDIPLNREEGRSSGSAYSLSSPSPSSSSESSSLQRDVQGLGILQGNGGNQAEDEGSGEEEDRERQGMVEVWGRREGRIWEEFCDFWRTGTGSAYVARIAKEEADVLVRFDGAGWWLQRRIHAAVRAGQILLQPLSSSDMDQKALSETASELDGARRANESEKKQRSAGGSGEKGVAERQAGSNSHTEDSRRSRVTPLRSAHPTGCELCGAGTGSPTSLLATASRPEPSRTGKMFRLSLDMEDGGGTASSENWRACTSCRGRLVAACEWWAWLRVVQGGLWHRDSEAAWAQSIRLRLGMWGARNEAWVGSKARLEERESVQVLDSTIPGRASWVHGWI
ncbi:hypothetical protein BJ684DRAFT_17309 [Piptocephalis cylindrospora]|uniref:GDP/GTP exchange factor Sec2 N-terminal domain-containing protein n=1 Tax=Piptocephalis cylindrospora TaxID=1907219 RepID=A0A4V1IXT5_9FUNG|nr:hypothetical protein BJ684DRAFT_17309 [Piptocephalis cylindrospora]|eukprot:RKP12179.1 hypothetical protein BJ684DRAFT_17309 [Piptocephalis cylindrospora]